MALCTEHQLDEVAGTSVTAIRVRNISTYALHVGHCVTGTTGQTTAPEHGDVRQVIAHIGYLVLTQIMTLKEVTVIPELHGRAQVDILRVETEGMETLPESFSPPPAQDAHMQLPEQGQLQGIAILDIDRAERPAVGSHGDNGGGENPVHVKQEGADTSEVIIDGAHGRPPSIPRDNNVYT